MADDVKFIIGVDDSDIITSIKNHEVLEKRIGQLSKEYTRLDKLLNTGRISSQVYAKAVQQVDSQIESLRATLKKGGAAVDQMATGMNKSGKAARRNELAFQQAGFQVQDFIVQVQGGTNPLLAFSQQASQLAGFFAGPWGAMIGLGIAALSSVGMAFLAAGKDAETLKKNLEGVSDKLGDFKKELDSAEKSVTSFSYAMAMVQRNQIEAAWAELGDATAGSFEASFMAKLGKFTYQNLIAVVPFTGGFQTWSEITGRLAGESFSTAFGDTAGVLSAQVLEDIGKAIKAKDIDFIDDQITALSAFGNITTEGAAFLQYLINIRDQANGFTDEVTSAAEQILLAKEYGEDLSGLNLKLGIEEANKVAELLQENLSLSLQDALAMVNLSNSLGTGVSGPDAAAAAMREKYTPSGINRDDIVFSGTFGGGSKTKTKPGGSKKLDPAEQLEKFMAQQEASLAIQRESILVGEKAARVTQLMNKYKEAGVELDEKEIQRIELLAQEEQKLQLLESAHNSMTNALMSVVDGTQTVGDAFKSMLRTMVLHIYQEMVAKQAVSGLFGFANGGVFSNGSQVNAFADGGVVGGPTYFPMSGGQTGLMGEAGPEAIMPLKRGADGKLGVQMNGGGEQVVVNQNINISTGVQQTVRNEIKSMMPQIAAQSKSAVLDAKRRGGAYGGKF